MKINQIAEFTPITIVLESGDEAEALWEAIRFATESHTIEFTDDAKSFLVNMSNWFSNSACL